MNRLNLSAWLRCGLLIGTALLPASARAGFTDIGELREAELGRLRILDRVYGGTFRLDEGASIDGVRRDYTNGTVSALRVPDFTERNDPVSVVGEPGGTGGAAADQFWADGVFAARAIARFSGYSQTFGYLNGTSGGEFTPLFDVGGSDLDVSGQADAINLRGQQWRWARTGETGTHTSADADNQDGRDHMLSYLITGVPGDEENVRWALFFEDLDLNDVRRAGRTTSDFNDLAVEVVTGPAATGGRGGDGGAIIIPLPAAAWPGTILFGAAAIAILHQKRRIH